MPLVIATQQELGYEAEQHTQQPLPAQRKEAQGDILTSRKQLPYVEKAGYKCRLILRLKIQ